MIPYHEHKAEDRDLVQLAIHCGNGDLSTLDHPGLADAGVPGSGHGD